MEHLHIIVDTIDSFKEHLTDNQYFEVMKSVSKLHEIIDNQDDDSDLSSVVSETESDINTESDIDIQNEMDIIDIDLLLSITHKKQMKLLEYMISNNLPEDFLTSSFNLSEKAAYNYVTNQECTCENDKFCNSSLYSFVRCRNIDNIIMNHPLLLVIYKNCCECCTHRAIYDINKYNLFSFDGNFNKNPLTQKQNFINNMKFLLDFNHNINSLLKGVNFINIYYYILNNGYNILKEEHGFRNSVYNRIFENLNEDLTNDIVDKWLTEFNIRPDLFQVIVDNLKAEFSDL